jgi:FAD dependent oxidoreductase
MASGNSRRVCSSIFRVVFGVWLAGLILPAPTRAQSYYDVVVYGGTAAGVISAVSAAREGMSVALLEPGRHLGGMASGGLSATDIEYGNKTVVGGYALEFYRRVAAHYEISRYGDDVAWYYEPHIGGLVFSEMVREASVKVFFDHRLREKDGVKRDDLRIAEIRMENGTVFRARVYIDCSYEGDLMAQAGVSYTWGREPASQYRETLAGVREQSVGHQWLVKVSPYDEGGKLLPEVSPLLPGTPSAADKEVEAYNFRLCLTQERTNQVAFPKPSGYDPRRYELLTRLLHALREKDGRYPRFDEITRIVVLPHGKADFNNNGAFSTDYIGGSWDYPEANYRRRAEIRQEHVNYIKGFFYFLAHDPRVPTDLQHEVNRWGLAKDEFTDTENWPHQLYVREARRLVGEYIMTQRDAQVDIRKPDSVGMGAYKIDSHNTHRYVTPDGRVLNEGDTQVPLDVPYQIPYRILLPKRTEVANLLVPVCVSASHIAYSTLRMEPQYMIMGQAAGVAASIAVMEHMTVQEVDAARLAYKLKQQGAVLESCSH